MPHRKLESVKEMNCFLIVILTKFKLESAKALTIFNYYYYYCMLLFQYFSRGFPFSLCLMILDHTFLCNSPYIYKYDI